MESGRLSSQIHRLVDTGTRGELLSWLLLRLPRSGVKMLRDGRVKAEWEGLGAFSGIFLVEEMNDGAVDA